MLIYKMNLALCILIFYTTLYYLLYYTINIYGTHTLIHHLVLSVYISEFRADQLYWVPS